MKLNEDTIKGKWREIKGEVQKAWGKLTDDDLDKTKGDAKAISGLIQQKYGKTKEGYDKKLTGILKRFEDQKEKAVKEVKKSLKH
ncbi:MAG: hypothetical protein A2X86_21770 [Bdellovibrionales bacterium GWA2_49_15]|nr:MAG: hypothetical protein A2X86_21770 [Bdellovibrionales bacterium GWA2_49_15]HAZ12844.1 CsbD family protein [Bdellovibrionales bacterium]